MSGFAPLLTHATSRVDIYLFAVLIGAAGTGCSVVCRSTIIGNYFKPNLR